MEENNTGPQNMKTFSVIWFGQLISTLGSGLTGFALGVWIYQETGSTSLFALNVLAFALPGVLLSPFAGALVDRWNRRLVLIGSDTLAGLSTLVVWLLLSADALEVWHIIVLTILNSIGNTFQFPAYSAAITMLVPREQLGRAGGMVQIGQAISQLVSPAIAGILFVTIGMPGIVLIDFVTFGFAILSLALIRIPEPKRADQAGQDKPSLWQEVKFGWGYITERTGLLHLLLYFAVLNFAFGMQTPVIMPMLLDMATADQAGIVSSIMGAGMLVGTLVMSAWGGPKKRTNGVLLGGAISGVSLIVLGAQPSLTIIAVAGFISLLVLPITNASSQAIWQSKTAPDVQGRVFSVRRMIAQFTFPIAVVLSGTMVDNVFQPLMNEGGSLANSVGQLIGVGPGRGAALLFILLGLMVFVASMVAYVNPRLRNLEEEIPDAEIVVQEQEPMIAEEAPAAA